MAVLKDLIVHGRSHFINGAQFNTINAESIGADAGIFNKLIATTLDATTATIDDLTAKNATVTALLDVQGDMHTNSWSNSNIATIDGSFYITPTSVSSDGSDIDASSYTPTGTITYSSSNFTKLSITGTFDTSQLTLNDTAHVAWPANSEVIVSGDVLVGNEWLPLGTIRGKLESQVAATNASKTISVVPLSTTLTDGQGHMPVTLETIRTGINLSSGTSTALKMRKVKVSLTSRASGSTQYPVGILLSAQGTGTGQTFIDIYGGNNARNGQSGTINGSTKTFTKPMVRLGNLEGLPSLAGQTPSGWGIYTSNGFFEGAIVAKEGYIGNTGSYWTIGGGTSSGATYMYSGPSTVNATSTAGTYLGTNGFLNTASSTTYAQITNGVLTAQGAIIQGALTATSLATGNPARTGTTAAAGTYIDSTGAIYGGNNKFTVTSAGVLTATDAKLNNLTLYDSNGYKRAAVTTSGFIIYDGASATTTTQLSSFTATSGNATIKLGQEAANKFNVLITDSAVSGKGPGILLRQGTNVLNEINAEGMNLYDSNANHLLSITPNKLEYISLSSTDTTFFFKRSDESKYYLQNSLDFYSFIQNYNMITTNKSYTFSDLSSLSSGTPIIIATVTYHKLTNSSGSDWTPSGISYLIFNKNTSKTATLFGINDASISVTYNGNANFSFALTNGSATLIGYGPHVLTASLSSAPSYGHIGRDQTAGIDKLRGNHSFSMNNAIARGTYSCAINGGEAFGDYSFAAGISTAAGYGSTAFGTSNISYGSYSFVAGHDSEVFKHYGVAIGRGLKSINYDQTVFGKYNKLDTNAMFIIGNGTADDARSNLMAIGDTEVTIGNQDGGHTIISTSGMKVYGADGTIELANIGYGSGNGASGMQSAPYYTLGERAGQYVDQYSETETYNIGALCIYNEKIYVCNTRIEGEAWNADHWTYHIGNFSTVENTDNVASGWNSHAEGWATAAISYYCHAEGSQNVALGDASHAEGDGTKAYGHYSHSEGQRTTAEGRSSHSEGFESIAKGYYSHAQNEKTEATKRAQTVIGTWNGKDVSTTTTHPSGTADYGQYAFIIGNGVPYYARSNALTVDWSGKIKCGDYSGIFKSIFNIFYPKGSYYETSLPATPTSGHSYEDDNLTDAEIADCGNSWFDPRIVWGGTWVLENPGYVHVSSGTGYLVSGADGDDGKGTKDGGESTHTLTTTEMPSHTHTQNGHSHTPVSPATSDAMFPALRNLSNRSGLLGMTSGTNRYGFATNSGYADLGISRTTGSTTATNQNTGGGGAHNNMQPYINVYRWHRTA